MSSISALIQLFFTVVSRENTFALWNVASAGLVVYDHILTLPREVQLVWPFSMGVAKGLYFATKYSAFLDVIFILAFQFAPGNMSLDQCQRLYRTFITTHLIGMLIAEGTLVLRTWAIWSRNNRVGYGLLVCWCVLFGVSTFIVSSAAKQMQFSQRPAPNLFKCWTTDPGPPIQLISTCFILVGIFESVICVLTVFPAFKHYTLGGSKLALVLYRDGVLYYICALAVCIANIILLKNQDPSLIMFQRVMHSILTTRMLLHIREGVLGQEGQWAPTDTHLSAVTQFTSG